MVSADGSHYDLSERERAVIDLVVDGMRNDEIAATLHVSTRTVQAHVAAGMRKLGARSRTQLAVYALRSGLIPLHPSDDRSDP